MGTELGHRELIARKNHICSWCGETIRRRTRYHKYIYCEDNLATTYKMHIECREAEECAEDMYIYFDIDIEYRSRGCMCPKDMCTC